MLHDRSALIDQFRTHLTQQRYNPVVIHNQCRGAEHFLEYLAQRNDEVSGARRPVPFSFRFVLSYQGVSRPPRAKWGVETLRI
jgi:hypothetical protein